MYTASRMQNMVQIREKRLFRDQLTSSFFWKKSFGALGVESPHGGAILNEQIISSKQIIDFLRKTYIFEGNKQVS